jgi:hypothetical protein
MSERREAGIPPSSERGPSGPAARPTNRLRGGGGGGGPPPPPPPGPERPGGLPPRAEMMSG